MKKITNKLSTSNYVVYAVVLLLAIVSGLLSSVIYLDSSTFDLSAFLADNPVIKIYHDRFMNFPYSGLLLQVSAGIFYGASLLISVILLGKYLNNIRSKARLYSIAFLSLITSSIGYYAAYWSFYFAPYLLGIEPEQTAFFVGGLVAGIIGAFITFLPLQFTEFFKRRWMVVLLGGLLAAAGSVLAFDVASSNGFSMDGIFPQQPLLLFLTWQVGMSAYLVFCSYRRSRYNINRN